LTFPRSVGQIPIYYNHFNTGRPPRRDNDTFYVCSYIDLLNSPKYPFGFGLSYTIFKYSNLRLSSNVLSSRDSIQAKFNVSNIGLYAGSEIIQLYIRDHVASVVQPVKSLKGFKKLFFQRGETKTVVFNIDVTLLSFYNADLVFGAELGFFDIMIGSSSAHIHLNESIQLIQ